MERAEFPPVLHSGKVRPEFLPALRRARLDQEQVCWGVPSWALVVRWALGPGRLALWLVRLALLGLVVGPYSLFLAYSTSLTQAVFKQPNNLTNFKQWFYLIVFAKLAAGIQEGKLFVCSLKTRLVL